MSYQYIRDYYHVPAEYGRRVICYGEPGIIVEDRGNYIGVNLDKDKPCVIGSYHPTDQVEYLEIGKPRKMTRSQQRYRDYLKVGECYDSFIHYLRCQNWSAKCETTVSQDGNP